MEEILHQLIICLFIPLFTGKIYIPGAGFISEPSIVLIRIPSIMELWLPKPFGFQLTDPPQKKFHSNFAPEKWCLEVGRRSFPFGMANFQGLCFNFQGVDVRVHFFQFHTPLWKYQKFHFLPSPPRHAANCDFNNAVWFCSRGTLLWAWSTEVCLQQSMASS